MDRGQMQELVRKERTTFYDLHHGDTGRLLVLSQSGHRPTPATAPELP